MGVPLNEKYQYNSYTVQALIDKGQVERSSRSKISFSSHRNSETKGTSCFSCSYTEL